MRAKGRTAEANLLLMDVNYEFAALKAEHGITAEDAKSFERELSRQPGGEDAALLRLFDESFDMTLDEDGDGAVTASELRAFGKSGDEFEPKWAKGDRIDARNRLRLRGEYVARLSSLPPGIDRRAAAKEVLKQFQARYTQGRFEDAISYMSEIFTDMQMGAEVQYAAVRKGRADAASRAERERRRRAEGVYATPEAAAKLDREERGDAASFFEPYGAEPWNVQE